MKITDNHARLVLISLILIGLLGAISIEIVLAQTGGGYDLSWSTIDGGGGSVSSGGYQLIGTIGQPDAGAALTGGGYTLTGGFWPVASSGGVVPPPYSVYLPLISK
jgi:hypothetical protein